MRLTKGVEFRSGEWEVSLLSWTNVFPESCGERDGNEGIGDMSEGLNKVNAPGSWVIR
jgi:hypothetical protein